MQTTIPYSDTPRTFHIELNTKMLNQMKMVEDWRGYVKALSELDLANSADVDHRIFEEAYTNIVLEGASISTQRAMSMVENEEEPQTSSEKEFLNYFSLLRDMDHFVGNPGERREELREIEIRQIHSMIVEDTLADSRDAGRYRTGPVTVGQRDEDGSVKVFHQPPEATEVPYLMSTFVDWLNTASKGGKGKLNALIIAALAHYEFVRIHPFVDGNGRTARFLTTALLLRHGYDFRKLFCITEHYNRDRNKYSSTLRSVDEEKMLYQFLPAIVATQDAEPKAQSIVVHDASAWVEYFLGGLARQMLLSQRQMINRKDRRSFDS